MIQIKNKKETENVLIFVVSTVQCHRISNRMGRGTRREIMHMLITIVHTYAFLILIVRMQ